MSLGNFIVKHEDVVFRITADEELSPGPPELYIREKGSVDWGISLTPVIEDTNHDSVDYNEFCFRWETEDKLPGDFEIKVQDTDLAGNLGVREGEFTLINGYDYCYGYDYGNGQ